MAIVAHLDRPVSLSITNALEGYPDWIPIDPNLTPLGTALRTLTHLHGGFVAAAHDGNPIGNPTGYGFGGTQHTSYPNAQPPTLLWFHDHAPGATRLNVFAGLAGAYLIRDALDTGEEPNPLGIPGGRYEIPLVIQDRSFNADGTFHYPTSLIPGVTWIGEYFGDVMLVNGKAWPYVDVEPRWYRLRILNGCNARILDLDIGGAAIWQIGAEGGLFDVPVPVKELVLAPAERADVLVDFSGAAGQTLVLRNQKCARPVVSPAPNLAAVMQIRVGITVSAPGPAGVPLSLPGVRADLPEPANRRFFTLNEREVDEPAWMLDINGQTFHESTLAPDTIAAGSIEEWTYVNLTGDTHPMHVHLTMFQVIGRTPFDAEAYEAAHGGDDGDPGAFDPAPFATGPMEPPAPVERGFKDTVKVNPGYFTTVRARFDLPPGATGPQDYVQHCHIVEHEDNDMMRAFRVV
jgi:spore coat protein A